MFNSEPTSVLEKEQSGHTTEHPPPCTVLLFHNLIFTCYILLALLFDAFLPTLNPCHLTRKAMLQHSLSPIPVHCESHVNKGQLDRPVSLVSVALLPSTPQSWSYKITYFILLYAYGDRDEP